MFKVNNDFDSKKKRDLGQLKEQTTRKLAEQILTEARKIARLEVKATAEQILMDATSISRWEKKPFYIA